MNNFVAGQGSCEKHGTTWAVVEGCAGCPICTEESEQMSEHTKGRPIKVEIVSRRKGTPSDSSDWLSDQLVELGRLETENADLKAVIRKLVEAGEGAEKTFILIHKLRNFRDEKDLRADECREEIKTLASTLSTVITEANEVIK